MAAYEGQSKRIKNAVKAVLADIKYDAGDGAEQAVYVKDSSHGAFESYPGVRLLPADVDDQKASVRDNERTVKFLAIVILPMENTSESESATYDKMYDLTDLILDTLDQGDADSVLNTVDSTLNTYFLNATRADWYPVEENAGIILACDINIEVKYSKQLS